MFGKLTLDALPLDSPIQMAGGAFMGVLVLAFIVYLVRTRKWSYLWKEWLTSLDHKKIGIMYMVLASLMLVRGFIDAIMMRSQQAMAYGPNQGILSPEHFDQIFSVHGTIMILFMAMPFIIGLMNIVLPLQIGSRDVAFPFMNSVSLWLTWAGALLVNLSLVIGEFAQTGWSAYPPLSELRFSPESGVDYYIWALEIAGAATLMSGINFLVTILRMRAPGMTLRKMPIFTWTSLCTNMLIIGAFPVLTVTLGLLALDRYLGMHFFTNDGGGNMMMYANLFWDWGHPEVYIVILPAFGIFSEVVPTFSGKALFGYTSMVVATFAITFLSFTVWLHHFFTMGSGGDVNAVFGISTMLIAVPTGVKIFNWLFTMFRGRVRFTTPMLWTIGFMLVFTMGGMAGVLLAMPGADFVLHNSLFLIAHFHTMLIGGTVFGVFAGVAYWFPKAFGFQLDEKLGKRAFWSWLIGFFIAFAPLYVLGFLGMTRRLVHYDNPAYRPWLIVAAVGVAIILFGILNQIAQLVVSIVNREKNRDNSGDPWNGRTLEWSIPSPPPPYNFAIVPEVHGIDAFWEDKRSGSPKRPVEYVDISLPRNSVIGILIGAFSLGFGFGMVWHIWWLAIPCLIGIVAAFVARASNEDHEYEISAAEVERIELDRRARVG